MHHLLMEQLADDMNAALAAQSTILTNAYMCCEITHCHG